MTSESHVRIDEGIKRGPRKRKEAPQQRSDDELIPPLQKVQITQPRRSGKLAEANLEDILTRYLSDETTAEIADSLNVHRSALHQWLLRNAEEPWKQAQIARAITALETAKDGLGSANDALSLARAREQLRGAQWELERVFSRIYGQKQEVKIDVEHHVTIDHELTESAQSLLAKLRGVASTPNAALLTPVIDITPET